MRDLRVGHRTVVFREGEPAGQLFLVKSGEVLCLKASRDRLIPVFLAKPGDVIGEAAMIPRLAYTYSAISLEPGELVGVPAANFAQVFKESPEWITQLTQTMIERFQHTANLIAENRLIHPSVLGEDQFTSTLEIEFKRLLAQ
jgi:CRP-like cAMP-binding protein